MLHAESLTPDFTFLLCFDIIHKLLTVKFWLENSVLPFFYMGNHGQKLTTIFHGLSSVSDSFPYSGNNGSRSERHRMGRHDH
jgi:hypothetical protein